ncbi:MAG: phytanoyl-CoA dioxygenase family protein [Paenibacillaceae bacterium]|nr:phytanoyl-CoA dioxygenase family protein [Paenibacillaceae bacterium]
MGLSQQQIDFFGTFGYLKLPGLFRDEIEWMTAEYTAILDHYAREKHDGSKTTGVVPFIDKSEALSGLLDDPRINEVCVQLLGADFNYMGSDGAYYSGPTRWHPDGDNRKRLHIKITFYLDRLDGSNGALRVIPGSHRLGDLYADEIKLKAAKSQTFWGLEGDEVPAQIIAVEPGDLLLFNHNTFHSSWNGGSKRRMFTLNLSQRFDDLEELKVYSVQHAHSRRHQYYGPAMIATAGEERQRHLEQLMSLDGDLYARTAHLPEEIGR